MEENNALKSDSQSRILRAAPSLFVGAILLACGFFAGWYWQQTTITDLVKIELVQPKEGNIAPIAGKEAENTPSEEVSLTRTTESAALQSPESCALIGSKNSDKYHSPQSAPAKRIKEENKVCFASVTEATEAGYEEGTVN